MLNQVFISYRHESPEHARAVRRLGELLKQADVPVVLDQFFLDDNPGGPDIGWPKWCEDCASQSQCVLIIASDGWFAAYERTKPPDFGHGAAAEADLFRQDFWDKQGNNTRIRVVFLNNIAAELVPKRLRAWHQFRPFDSGEQLDQLVRWLAQRLGLEGIQSPTVCWPAPVPFQPDLADRNKMEWPAVVDLLAGKSRERILLFEGESGLGKSELLRQATAYAKKLGMLAAPVNLRGVVTVDDVLGQIDLELGSVLVNFSREGASKTYLLRKDLRALRQPVFLIFDAYETVVDKGTIADWLNQQLLAEVETALSMAVIVAGQRVPDLAKSVWRDLARHIPLQPINDLEPWQEWFSRRYQSFEDKRHLPTALILSGGNPSVMANFCAVLAKSGASHGD